MNIIRRQSISFGLTLTLFTIFGLTACGGGDASTGADGGIIATGRALVNGNVATSTLPGDLNDIEVSILNRTTRTNTLGEFSLADVEAGTQQVIFRKGGETASLALSILSQSQTTLSNIHIDSDTVSTESIEVEDHSTVENVEDTEDDQDSTSPEDEDNDDDSTDNTDDNGDDNGDEDDQASQDQEDQPEEENDDTEKQDDDDSQDEK